MGTTCEKVHEELERAITHFRLAGLVKRKKVRFMHEFFKFGSRRITTKDTDSVSIGLRKDGFFLLVNPYLFTEDV